MEICVSGHSRADDRSLTGLAWPGKLLAWRVWQRHVQFTQTIAELAAVRGARCTVWRGLVGAAHGEASGAAIDLTSTWSPLAKTTRVKTIAVGMALTGHPPRRSVRAGLPHTALTLDVDAQTARSDTDAGSSASVANVARAWRTCPKSDSGRVGCDVAARGAIILGSRRGIAAGGCSCRAQRNTGTSRETRLAATRQPVTGRRGFSATVQL
jgi:hypothetical protein